jgi:hypothetical protein
MALPRSGLILFSSLLLAQNPGTNAPATWKPLEFLLGTWDAKTRGGSAGAASSGTYTFQLELRGHVLARHSSNADCKGPADFDCEHADLFYVYQESPGKPLKAIYFDNEGHVINYELTTPAPNTAVFISPSSQPGPQFRLVYELKDGTMEGRFQLRMPGQSEFKSNLEWSGKRK